jgi:hypothetical protein
MKKYLIAILFYGLLPGCSIPSASLPLTATAPIAASTPTTTPAPSPTPSATPLAPLDEEGPWLAFSLPGESNHGIIITNLDGSGYHQIKLPQIFEPIQISGSSSPNGAHAAIRVTNPELEASNQVLSTSLWIISLPNGEVVRKIPLTGEHASLWLEENPPTATQGLSTTILGAPYKWSPDGRFLAFSGALDGESTDLYIYDIVADQIIQLTDGSKQAVIHSWSPDSRWILHEATMFYIPEARVIYSSWAASVEGEVVRLEYGPFNNHPIIGWFSEETLLTYTRRDHGSSKELRLVNLRNGNTEYLYNQPFYEAAFDPDSSAILLNLQPVDFASANSLPGIYLLDLEAEDIKMILPGTYSGLSWETPNKKFSTILTGSELIFFTPHQRTTITLPYSPNDQISYSPNQHWLLISNQQHSSIYTLWGELALEINQPGNVLWLPDSSGFFFYSRADGSSSPIYQYLREKDWEAEIFREDFPISSSPVLIAP